PMKARKVRPIIRQAPQVRERSRGFWFLACRRLFCLAPFVLIRLEARQQRVHVQPVAHHKAQQGYGEQQVANEKGNIVDHGCVMSLRTVYRLKATQLTRR
ncbi:MAG: hypothetical protein AAFQ13_10800, partial [Pseudomonadota bacterium]